LSGYWEETLPRAEIFGPKIDLVKRQDAGARSCKTAGLGYINQTGRSNLKPCH